MKNPIKNMHKKIDGLVFCGSQLIPLKLDVIITNDKLGKTLSVGDGKIQYTFAFEQIERYLK